MYKITEYSKQRAKEYNVILKPSTRGKYKIDIFDKDGSYINSIGDVNYLDYPTYLRERGKEFADERRRLYHIRHKKDISAIPLAVGAPGTHPRSRGWWSSVILW